MKKYQVNYLPKDHRTRLTDRCTIHTVSLGSKVFGFGCLIYLQHGPLVASFWLSGVHRNNSPQLESSCSTACQYKGCLARPRVEC